jgi:hypothetical protein
LTTTNSLNSKNSKARAYRKEPSKGGLKEVLVDMTHQEKVDHLIEELGHQGISSCKVAPHIYDCFGRSALSSPPTPS